MKHDSLADFEDKVTSTELYNVTIKKNHLCTIVWKAYLFPYVSVLKVVCLLSAKSQKVLDTVCKIEKIHENKNVLHATI
jgi:hypothetical protein